MMSNHFAPISQPPPPTGPRNQRRAAPKQPVAPATISLLLATATVVAAFIGNVAFRQTTANTAAMATFVAATACALAITRHINTTTARLMLVGAAVFGGFVAVRTEPRLLVFNLIAASVFLLGSAVFGRGGSIRDCGPVRLVFEAADAALSWLTITIDGKADAAARLSETKARHRSQAGIIRAALVGIGLAVPIVVVLGKLLASGDAVFASFVSIDFGGVSIVLHHILITVLVATVIIALQRKSSRPAEHMPSETVRVRLGSVESVVILSSVNALFALFAAAQIYALSGAAERILEAADLTAKDYARQGFFQLLWVAGLTLALIAGLFTLRNRVDYNSAAEQVSQRRDAVTWLSYVSALLTMGIVAVAIGRLTIYIEFGGLTPLRFYSLVFCAWIAVAFGIVVIRVSGVAASKNWLTPALLGSGLACLLGLNMVNPEGIIANYNLDRHAAEDDAIVTDWTVLGADRLTGDGHLVLMQRSGELSPQLQENLRQAICVTHRQPASNDGALGWNRSDSAFQTEREQFCREV